MPLLKRIRKEEMKNKSQDSEGNQKALKYGNQGH